jgi:hypothetical protein
MTARGVVRHEPITFGSRNREHFFSVRRLLLGVTEKYLLDTRAGSAEAV